MEYNNGIDELNKIGNRNLLWGTAWKLVSNALNLNGNDIFIYVNTYPDSSTPFDFQYGMHDGVDMIFSDENNI